VTVLREPVPARVADSGPGRGEGADPGPTERTTLLGTPRSSDRLEWSGRVLSRVRPLAFASVAAVLLLTLASVYFSRGPWGSDPASTAVPQAHRRATAAPAAAPVPGRLQLVATPFARIVSITEVGTERSLALEEGVTTPYLAQAVPPGRYRVVLVCPSLEGRMVEREVTVDPAGTTLLAEPFLPPSALAATLK